MRFSPRETQYGKTGNESRSILRKDAKKNESRHFD
jgi:hypothetical protein